MNNMTDKEIGAAIGRLIKEYQGKGDSFDCWSFLNSLIPVEKEWNPKELKVGDVYWTLSSGYGDEVVVICRRWEDTGVEKFNRAQGCCHPTKEAAEQWRDRIISEYENK